MTKIFNDVKEFTVDRSKWLRGTDDDNNQYSCLLDMVSNKMCCLGFYAKACGLSSKNITDLRIPSEVNECNTNLIWKTKLISKSDGYDIKSCNEIMIVNDSSRIDDKTRESKLKKLFSQLKIKIKFVGKR